MDGANKKQSEWAAARVKDASDYGVASIPRPLWAAGASSNRKQHCPISLLRRDGPLTARQGLGLRGWGVFGMGEGASPASHAGNWLSAMAVDAAGDEILYSTRTRSVVVPLQAARRNAPNNSCCPASSRHSHTARRAN